MSLVLDPALDLGRDGERMNSDDARRQTATVNRLLKAFTAEPDDRRELQLLADEVGLGKTFVALATGYTLMNFVRTKRDLAAQAGLGQCGGAMIVVVPSSLTKKWAREVEALRTRCSTDPRRTDWFRGRICDDVYDLADGVRRASDLRRSPAKNPCVLICSSGIFGKRVAQRGWSLRFLAACLFRWWGNRLSMHERFRIVSRAAEVPEFADWASSARRKSGGYEVDLWNFASHEEYLTASESERADWPREAQVICDATPFVYEDVRRALDAFNRTEAGRRLLENDATELRDGHEEQVGLLPFCKDAAQRRGHADWYFRGFQLRLADLYKKLARHLIERDVPLVVVDEAHHWRNAQRQDCKLFGEHLAPLTRRMLLLTATPFQLHSDELLNVLAAGDKMEAAIGADRVQRLQ
ncbi:MAG TPA: SNF2-related protein, partial [Pirellulales bacterium]